MSQNQGSMSQRALLTSNFEQSFVQPSLLNLDAFPALYGSQSQVAVGGMVGEEAFLPVQQQMEMSDATTEPTKPRTLSLKKRMDELMGLKPLTTPALEEKTTQTEYDGAYFSKLSDTELKAILSKLIQTEDFIQMADRLETFLRSDNL